MDRVSAPEFEEGGNHLGGTPWSSDTVAKVLHDLRESSRKDGQLRIPTGLEFWFVAHGSFPALQRTNLIVEADPTVTKGKKNVPLVVSDYRLTVPIWCEKWKWNQVTGTATQIAEATRESTRVVSVRFICDGSICTG